MKLLQFWVETNVLDNPFGLLKYTLDMIEIYQRYAYNILEINLMLT